MINLGHYAMEGKFCLECCFFVLFSFVNKISAYDSGSTVFVVFGTKPFLIQEL